MNIEYKNGAKMSQCKPIQLFGEVEKFYRVSQKTGDAFCKSHHFQTKNS